MPKVLEEEDGADEDGCMERRLFLAVAGALSRDHVWTHVESPMLIEPVDVFKVVIVGLHGVVDLLLLLPLTRDPIFAITSAEPTGVEHPAERQEASFHYRTQSMSPGPPAAANFSTHVSVLRSRQRHVF